MDNKKEINDLGNEINVNSFSVNWLWLIPILMLYLKKGSEKLNIFKIETESLDNKVKLLNRIKGYMSSEEQLIIHRAEMLLHIISKVKAMMETPDILSATTYSSLSLADKKRNMLMDISEFVDEEKRGVIHKAIDLHLKANHVEGKIKEIQSLETSQINIESIEKYIELFDPILEGQLKNKTKELKVLMGVLKLMKSLEKKDQFNEMDLIEIITPFVGDEQREQMTKMIQLVKVFSTIGNDNTTENSIDDLKNKEDLLIEENNSKEEVVDLPLEEK